jgi:hypothetical protein
MPEEDMPSDKEPRHGHRRRRLLWLTLGAVMLAGGGGAAYLLSIQDGNGSTTEEATGPATTAEVAQETISDTRDFDGTLGYGDALTVATPGQGVITGTASQNTAVDRGEELFRLNEQPVTAMFGSVPMYRDLTPGTSGPDVEQLINNLDRLGYVDCESTDELNWCVQEAIMEWQDDIGANETGTVAQTDVVFVPKGSRVDTIHAGVASVVQPGTSVLDLTGNEQVVSLEVDVADRDLLSVDTNVTVTLPGGEDVEGTVTAANTVPVEPEGGGAGGDDEAGADDAVTEVEVTLNEAVDESLLGGPAEVAIEVDERADVLTVPVNALLALAEGGHGLEVVNADGSTEIVPVDTGLFADGKVEVTGSGIAAGTVVGVAGR